MFAALAATFHLCQLDRSEASKLIVPLTVTPTMASSIRRVADQCLIRLTTGILEPPGATVKDPTGAAHHPGGHIELAVRRRSTTRRHWRLRASLSRRTTMTGYPLSSTHSVSYRWNRPRWVPVPTWSVSVQPLFFLLVDNHGLGFERQILAREGRHGRRADQQDADGTREPDPTHGSLLCPLTATLPEPGRPTWEI